MKDKKIIITIMVFVCLIMNVYGYTTLEDYQDLRYEQIGVDLWNTKALKIPSLSDTDHGFVSGDKLQLIYGETNLTGDVDDDTTSVSCHFFEIDRDSSQDVVYNNGTHLVVVSPKFGSFLLDRQVPDPRSPISCYDFDGDSRDEIIMTNFQAGEHVIQVFDFNTTTSEIEQLSVNVLSDDYNMIDVGQISCNDFGTGDKWRCFFVGYNPSSPSYAELISIVKNPGENNFYFADDELIYSATLFSSYPYSQNHVLPGDSGNKWYTWWGDRVYYFDYSESTETWSLSNWKNTSGKFIVDVVALNDLKRGSKSQSNTDRYENKIAVVSFNDSASDFALDLYDKNLLNVTSSKTGTGCDYVQYNSQEMKAPVFSYDLYGDGYKDILFHGYNHIVGGLIYCGASYKNVHYATECIGAFNINSSLDIVNFAKATSGYIYTWSGCVDDTESFMFDKVKNKEEPVILDVNDDLIDDVFFIDYNPNGGTVGENKAYVLDSSTFGSTLSTVSMNFARDSLETAMVFGDFNMDEYIDVYSPVLGKVTWHNDGESININPIFSYNNTEFECGYYSGNPDNFCEVTVNSTYAFTVNAIDPEGDTIKWSYRCDDDEVASPLKDYSLTNQSENTFFCTYNYRKNASVQVWVTDENMYENLQQNIIVILSESGTVCLSNNVCEYRFGETITNCPSDCVACNDGLDNDNDTFIDYPDDIGCYNSLDGNENNVPQCNDGFDNDGDGLIDYPDDLECSSLSDESERLDTECDDGIDNDLDGLIDYPTDTSCQNKNGTSESNSQCNDDIDNDGDGWTDFPDDVGCDDIYDNDETNYEPISFYDTQSWWSQYQYDNENFGYNQFVSQAKFDSGITKERLIVDGDFHQSLIADFDSDNTPEFAIIENGDLYIMYWDSDDNEFDIEYSVSLDAFTPAIPTTIMDATPVAHKYGNKIYIVLLDSNKVYTLQYASGGALLQSYTNSITGDASMTGISCQENTPYCWLVTDDNKVVRVNILEGTINLYETDSSLQSFNQELYREIAVRDIDNLDEEELIFTFYDKPNDDMGVVVFDIQDKVLDTRFSSDGILHDFCDSEGWSSWKDLFGIISNPLIADIYGDSRQEIVLSCAMYEENSGDYIARAFNHVITSSGTDIFDDSLLDDKNYIIFTYEDYMNHTTNFSEKYLVLNQPVVTVFEDGTAGFCTRAFHQTGTSSSNLITRGDIRCYQGALAVTEKYGKVCGDTSDDASINPCNYADNMTDACFFAGECGTLHTPVVADLYDTPGTELVNYFGIFNVSSLYENVIYEFAEDILPYDSEYSIGDVNKDDSLDVIVTSRFGSITDVYYSNYVNQYPTLEGFTVSTRSPVCLGTQATFTLSTDDYTDTENNPVQIQVALPGSEMENQWSESSSTPSDTYTFNVAGYITLNVWIKDIYMTNDQFENGISATFFVTSDTFNCFDFNSCHVPDCDPSVIPTTTDDLTTIENNDPANNTLPWSDAFIVNYTQWEYDEGSYESQLSLSSYPGIVFNWDECEQRGYKKTWSCLPRIVFWDFLSYILNTILNNVKIIIVFVLIIVFLVILGYSTYNRVIKG